MANATLRYRQAQYKSCPLIIKDGQNAHPTKLGNLFFGVPLDKTVLLIVLTFYY
ncbi:MAG: hypothetical protein ACK5RT_05280 [Dolichospermum sp.]|jgi:hypothetical protein